MGTCIHFFLSPLKVNNQFRAGLYLRLVKSTVMVKAQVKKM